MAFKHVYDPVASAEYINAYNWYKEKSEVAADAFIVAVEETVSVICENPLR